MRGKFSKYCCDQFKKAVLVKAILPSDKEGATNWFINCLMHVYFCPFCGRYINLKKKGQGYNKKFGYQGRKMQEICCVFFGDSSKEVIRLGNTLTKYGFRKRTVQKGDKIGGFHKLNFCFCPYCGEEKKGKWMMIVPTQMALSRDMDEFLKTYSENAALQDKSRKTKRVEVGIRILPPSPDES